MIKIGCAAYSYRDYLKDGRMRYEGFIEEAYGLSLDGVELTLYWLPSKDAAYFRKIRHLSALRGLSISGAGISTSFCSPNVAERQKTIKSVEEGLEIAQVLGAPCLRVFAGHVPDGYTLEQATEWTTESLRLCAGPAEDRGVVVAMENHGGITASADNVVKMIKAVDSRWVRVNLDLGNYRQSPYEEIAKTVPYAIHIHAKVTIAGDGSLDYRRIREILGAGGYNGFVSIEYEEKDDAKTGVPRFAKYLFEVFR